MEEHIREMADSGLRRFLNRAIPIGVGLGGTAAAVYGVRELVTDDQPVDAAMVQTQVQSDAPAVVQEVASTNLNVEPTVDPVNAAVFEQYIQRQQARENTYAQKLALAKMQRESMEAQYGGQY
jgi:hypothetical protein